MRAIRPRLTYANVMSSIAVFAVLGGTAVAIEELPRNSVGGKQLRRNAVNSAKVANGSLKPVDFQIGGLPSGPAGPAGPQGPAGEQGPAGPFPGLLAAGKTIRGSIHIRTVAQAGEFPGTSISFGFQLAQAPVPHYVKVGDVPPAACPGSVGSPEAEPGHLCFYEAIAQNAAAATRCVFTTESAGATCGTSGRAGAGIQYSASGAGDFNVWGSWAVTGA